MALNEPLIKRPIYKYDSVNYNHYIDRESDDRHGRLMTVPI